MVRRGNAVTQCEICGQYVKQKWGYKLIPRDASGVKWFCSEDHRSEYRSTWDESSVPEDLRR